MTTRVLIVDDEESVRITLAEFIRDDQYVVHTAEDADEALRLMDEQAFDVVVSDIVLPCVNGVALMKEIRKRSPGTQVIMLTGDPTVESATAAVRAGAFDYLTKPVSQNAIRRVVANAARVKVLTDEKRRLEEENKKYQEHLEQLVDERTAELRESEDKFKGISANAQEAIIMLDASGKAIYWNAAAEKIFGYSTEEALGTDIHRITTSRKQYEDFEKGFINFHKTGKGRIIGSPLELTGRRKDGTEVPIEMSVSAVRLKGAWNAIAIIRDITARKQAQDALRRSEVRYRATFESTGTAMLVIEEDLTIALVNEQSAKLSGYSKDEVEGKMRWTDFVVKEDLERMKTYHDARRAEGGNAPESYEFCLVTREGKTRDILLTIGLIPGTKRSVASLADITKLKQAEEATRESEARYRGIVQYQTECIDRWLPDGTLTFVNDAYCQYYGKTRDELIGGKWKDVVVEEEREHMPEYAERLKATLTPEQPIVTNERREVAADGEIRWMQWSDQAIFDEQGSLLEFQSVGRDITKRKRAEEELRASEQRYRLLFERNLAGVYRTTLDGRVLDCNESYARIFGYDSQEEALARRASGLYFDAADREKFIAQLREQGTLINAEWCLRRKDGSPVWILENSSLIEGEEGAPTSIQGTLVDITKRKRAERLLQALNQAALAMGKAMRPEEIFTAVAEELKKLGFFCAVLLTDESQKRLFPKYLSYEAKTIKAAEKLVGLKAEDLPIPVETVEVYRKVIRERKTVFVENAEEVVRQFLPGPAKRLARQIAKMLKLSKSIDAPLIAEDEVIGLLLVQSDDLTEDDMPAITAFAHQMAAAWRKAQLMQDLEKSLVEVKRSQEELQRTAENLRRTLGTTIHAMALTVETRDPYTAGHQRRVADLACAIAREMGVPEERVEGLHAAGLVHDIGKIAIPAEILTKPAKLSSLEYLFIQAHPQQAYDILKDIDFPWPIADIVLQHHERMNGSGYPKGLKGDEILLEARIIAVADVVEAMASHRPYRAAIGLEAALDEIKKNVGRLYDPAVVDACFAVFEKGFTLA